MHIHSRYKMALHRRAKAPGEIKIGDLNYVMLAIVSCFIKTLLDTA